jgi:hypothetical protein
LKWGFACDSVGCATTEEGVMMGRLQTKDAWLAAIPVIVAPASGDGIIDVEASEVIIKPFHK